MIAAERVLGRKLTQTVDYAVAGQIPIIRNRTDAIPRLPRGKRITSKPRNLPVGSNLALGNSCNDCVNTPGKFAYRLFFHAPLPRASILFATERFSISDITTITAQSNSKNTGNSPILTYCATIPKSGGIKVEPTYALAI